MEDISSVIRRCKRANETKLSLQGKGLISIPQDVFSLTSLQTLILSGNKITNIDQKITQLQQLTVLDLSNNSLTDIPSELLLLSKLENLILTNNHLPSIYDQIVLNQQQPGLRIALLAHFKLSEEDSPIIVHQSKNQGELKKPQYNQQLISEPTQRGQVMEVDGNEFEIGEIISQGGFSIVHKAILRGTEVALKKIFNPNITPELLAEIDNEIQMLAKFRHPNIVLLMAVTTKPPNLYIATEFMQKGSLYDLLHKTKVQISEVTKLKLSIQICKVLLYLHLSGIVHRDIKSHNILLEENYKAKLCDFGLARRISDLNQGSMQFSGTPSYMAPELFQKKAYDKGVDLFAFGTLIWELFAREVPYEGIDPQDIGAKVLKGDQLQGKNIPKSIQQLVQDLRQVDPKKRPEMGVVLKQLEQVSL